jgi:hypothetical protein
MKRVIIKNLIGAITHGAELQDPTSWISECVAHNVWGMKEQIKWKDECSPEELLRVTEETQIEIDPGLPGEPGGELPGLDPIPPTYRTQVKVAANYTIEIVDMAEEIEVENTRRAQIVALKTRLKALALQSDMTAAEVKETIMKRIKLGFLMKELD